MFSVNDYDRFLFIDVNAGPVVISTDLDDSNIHNLIPYELAYGSNNRGDRF